MKVEWVAEIDKALVIHSNAEECIDQGPNLLMFLIARNRELKTSNYAFLRSCIG